MGPKELQSPFVLLLSNEVYLDMLAHCLSELPNEACGLFAGIAEEEEVLTSYRTRNAADSAKLYAVDGHDMLKADRDAEKNDMSIMGVYHSHTHTDAFPSPTDVDQAPDPDWHYVIVSLRHSSPVVRSFTILDGEIEEESVVVWIAPAKTLAAS